VTDREHDVAVVGGGPAGVSAVLEAADIQLGVVVVEAGAALGGQLAEILHPIRNLATGRYERAADQTAWCDVRSVHGSRQRNWPPRRVGAPGGPQEPGR
jgi:succinate dehydrogenase/fumarate reductase flavoprotein subunit